jgi:D-alanyl-D-alanine dipeptidase
LNLKLANTLLTDEKERAFVADPSKGSVHNRGCAVDLTLFELSTGNEVSMPSNYDEMTERSHPDYTGGSEEQRQMRDLLRSKMEANGFTVYHNEWWHFDYKDWKKYRIENIQFSDIE